MGGGGGGAWRGWIVTLCGLVGLHCSDRQTGQLVQTHGQETRCCGTLQDLHCSTARCAAKGLTQSHALHNAFQQWQAPVLFVLPKRCGIPEPIDLHSLR